MTSPYFDQIQKDITENNVVLYMKGNKDFPQCGFSNLVVQVLNHYNIDFKDINILEDQELRQAIKDYTNWPTIPQLYVQGKFIGGADIVKEMYESGEIKDLFHSLEK